MIKLIILAASVAINAQTGVPVTALHYFSDEFDTVERCEKVKDVVNEGVMVGFNTESVRGTAFIMKSECIGGVEHE